MIVRALKNPYVFHAIAVLLLICTWFQFRLGLGALVILYILNGYLPFGRRKLVLGAALLSISPVLPALIFGAVMSLKPQWQSSLPGVLRLGLVASIILAENFGWLVCIAVMIQIINTRAQTRILARREKYILISMPIIPLIFLVAIWMMVGPLNKMLTDSFNGQMQRSFEAEQMGSFLESK